MSHFRMHVSVEEVDAKEKQPITALDGLKLHYKVHQIDTYVARLLHMCYIELNEEIIDWLLLLKYQIVCSSPQLNRRRLGFPAKFTLQLKRQLV